MKIIRDGVEIELTAEELSMIRNELEAPSQIRVETPMGAIIAGATYDKNYPGIWLDLRRDDVDFDMPLALVECTPAEGKYRPEIVTHVWGDAMQEEQTTRVVHERIEDFFRMEEVYDNC